MVIIRYNAAIRSIAFSNQAQHCGPASIFFSIPTNSKLGFYHRRPSCMSRCRSLSEISHRRETLSKEGVREHAVHTRANRGPNSRRRMPDQVSPSESHTALNSGLPKAPGINVPALTTDEDSGQSSNPVQCFPPQPFSRPYRHAQVHWKAFEGPFNAVYLRDCCSCDRCVDPSTTQKTFETADIPPNIKPRSVERKDDGCVHITWEPDLPGFEDHVSVFDSLFGGKNNLLQSRLEATSNQPCEPKLWNRDTMSQHQLSVDYDSYMESSSTLLACLQHLHLSGLLLIHSIPSSADAVKRICERVGPLKNTLYGSTWDVRSVPSAKNVAYTSSSLGFHMVR